MSLLLTPGPVTVPDFVLQAIQNDVIHHRSQTFYQFYEGLLSGLKYLFQTDQRVCTMISSGTGGVEAAMYSLFSEKDEILILNMGKFSSRWVEFAELLGCNVHEIKKEWGKSVHKEEILEKLSIHPHISGIILTHCETSTGVIIDLEEIAFAVKNIYPECLLVVDGITSAGAVPFYFDQWNIDLAITASQKSLMNPAGVVCFAVSELCLLRLKPTNTSDYRNLFYYVKMAEKNSFPYTPPVQLLFGINAALAYIRKHTLPVIWNTAHLSSMTFKSGLVNLGGTIFPENASDSLTAFYIPQKNVNDIKKELEVSYDIIISGGQGHLKGTILRISHMGLAQKPQMNIVLDALKKIIS